jgi:hypothetical protein
LCRKSVDGEELIGCDGKECQFLWFHPSCVGVEDVSTLPTKWFFPLCKPT